jgi:hypothetical protein
MVATLLERAKRKVVDAESDMLQLHRLHDDICDNRYIPNKRLFGRILHADPIGLGMGECTFDWGVVKVDKDRIDFRKFRGNKVFVCTSFAASRFITYSVLTVFALL